METPRLIWGASSIYSCQSHVYQYTGICFWLEAIIKKSSFSIMEHLNDPGREVIQANPHLVGVPYEKRWDLLKSTLRELFVIEEKTVPEIMRLIKDRYAFSAT